MAKCGKGCMPECEYFTTGGCISPFSCPYKIEMGYINSATSTTDGLTGILMEFDEMGLLRRQRRAPDPEQYAIEGREKVRKEIERPKSENADLRERLDKAERRAEVIELALALAVENHRCEGCPSKECDGSIRGTQKCRDTIALLYIVQAEREIEEEKGE